MIRTTWHPILLITIRDTNLRWILCCLNLLRLRQPSVYLPRYQSEDGGGVRCLVLQINIIVEK